MFNIKLVRIVLFVVMTVVIMIGCTDNIMSEYNKYRQIAEKTNNEIDKYAKVYSEQVGLFNTLQSAARMSKGNITHYGNPQLASLKGLEEDFMDRHQSWMQSLLTYQRIIEDNKEHLRKKVVDIDQENIIAKNNIINLMKLHKVVKQNQENREKR